ncbi:MAG: L-ribulose-5-phosphate 4-epimerase AraD [Treponema sp.]|nr:L-ribulose-5-phosphate 4-epimerase AraD [Treponema sp.]MCL2271775.1 L-ribulose-5-phosphate 4-epimerase AraD [Treponema sp.]
MDAFKTLREQAYEANMEIQRRSLAIYTWGNSSAFDPDRGIFAIKPSGVEYGALTPYSMVLLDLDGNIAGGKLKPSSDTKTHLVLYRNFPGVCGITHTHSPCAVAWAQANKPVPVFGTTHADHCAREIPCTDYMSPEAVKNNYELETGNLIVDTFKKNNLAPAHINMVLVAGHGPFTWGKSAALSVYNSVILEEICKMALFTAALDPLAKPLPEHITKKHWERKHGPDAYYGQR